MYKGLRDANDDASFLAFKTEFFFVFFLFAYATSFFSFVSIGIAILVAHELNRIFFCFFHDFVFVDVTDTLIFLTLP